jgi:hypothetical protein
VTARTNTSSPIRIFVSYSHKDVEQKEQVMTILEALPPAIEKKAWDDNRMRAGDDIDNTIFSEIENTDLFLALISRNYLASAYCREEMKTALFQAERRGCRVVPIIVRSTESWREYPIGQKLALPSDGKAPTDWEHEDMHWTAVEKGLLKLLKDMHSPQPDLTSEPKPIIHYQASIAKGPIDPTLLGRFRNLLVGLPRWSDRRRRRAFINSALWGHPVLQEIDLDGPGVDVATDLVAVCLERDEPSSAGQTPLCALLLAITQEYGPKPTRDREIAALSAALNCHFD